ncbi:histidine phosphatase family protein [Thalassobacillus devorans]|uniref:histidine phosphatase family protein n=1 Tax=Thalassobacillus devorans TaxID=279813 RepID=UPI000A1CE000|nr:histidine phosphatase family protein [Thalassobacillus devorans]
MLRLYITRHGETEWNVQKRMQGWANSELTDNGVENARILGENLKSTAFDAVYSSPSKRTRKTTELILGGRELPVTYEDKLKEIHVGDWEGQTKEFIEENYGDAYHYFFNKPHLYESFNGESFFELRERVEEFLEQLKRTHSSGNILVVTHSVFIKSLLAVVKGLPVEKLWGPPYIQDTSLSIVEMDGEAYHVIVEGDVSHKKNTLEA